MPAAKLVWQWVVLAQYAWPGCAVPIVFVVWVRPSSCSAVMYRARVKVVQVHWEARRCLVSDIPSNDRERRESPPVRPSSKHPWPPLWRSTSSFARGPANALSSYRSPAIVIVTSPLLLGAVILRPAATTVADPKHMTCCKLGRRASRPAGLYAPKLPSGGCARAPPKTSGSCSRGAGEDGRLELVVAPMLAQLSSPNPSPATPRPQTNPTCTSPSDKVDPG